MRILAFFGTLLSLIVLNTPTAAAETANRAPAFRYDKVYVQSRVDPALFAVNLAAERLDDHSRLDLVYVSSCPSTYQCITIVDADLPDYPLTTSRIAIGAVDGVAYYGRLEVDVANMKRAGYTAAHRTQTLLHEMGHVAGLGHNERSTSVMYDCGNCRPPVTRPDTGDFANLRGLYG
jgi:predicted Zn-dependent protease